MFSHPNLDAEPREVLRVPYGTVILLLLIVLGWVLRPESPFWRL